MKNKTSMKTTIGDVKTRVDDKEVIMSNDEDKASQRRNFRGERGVRTPHFLERGDGPPHFLRPLGSKILQVQSTMSARGL